jgi:PLP dependent protein
MTLKQRYEQILQVSKGLIEQSSPRNFKLIVVSKGVSVENIQELYLQGQRDFGENYLQELELKAAECAARGFKDIIWHFIGGIQSNKVKDISRLATYIHSVDRVKIVQELQKQGNTRNFFLQINTAQDQAKGGFEEDELDQVYKILQSEPNCIGLMTIGKLNASQDERRIEFQKLKNLRDDFQQKIGRSLLLSMGMSADYEIALEEGANFIRVGSAIWGS